MARLPSWPELLSLFEEPRFQLAAVAIVASVAALALAVTFPRAWVPSQAEPAPVTGSIGIRNVAGPEPVQSPLVTATSVSARPRPASSPAPALDVATTVDRPREPARSTAFAAGDLTQLVAPAPRRLSCTEAEAPLGVLPAGSHVEVIEVGVAACEGWLLVGSDGGLTWLLPAVLEPVEVVTSSESARP